MRSRIPKEIEPILKFNGEPLTRDDFHFLYCGAEKLSLYSIAHIFNCKPLLVYYHCRKYGIGYRKEDLKLAILADETQKEKQRKHALEWDEKYKIFQQEKDKQLWEEAKQVYGKPKPEPIVHIIGDKKYVDYDLVKAYNRYVKSIFDELKRKATGSRTPKIKVNPVRHVDLSAMRLHRGLDMYKFSEVSGLQCNVVKYYEKTRHVLIPEEISDIYFKSLNITKREFKKIIECLSGDRKSMHEEENRVIPDPVREYVWKRDGGKCRKCDRKEYLHYHHIEHYSKGGSHQAKNIKLLCVACHAMEHYGEKGYGMLKAQAEKLLGVNVC